MKEKVLKKSGQKFWLIVASKDHIEKGVSGGFAQACHGKMKPISKPQKGDGVLFYATREKYNENTNRIKRITAVGFFEDEKVDVHEIEDKLFYKRKVNFEIPIREINLKDYLKDIGFIENKEKWGMYLRSSMREIPKKDFDFLHSKMKLEKEN
jgi:hypothetical protein